MAETVDVVHNAPAHRFEATLGGETAVAAYDLERGAMVLTHTEVPQVFEGRGVGGALARAALGYAREQGLPVVPRCSFMAGYIAKHPEYRDVVRPDFRERLGL